MEKCKMCANVWNKTDPACRYCEDHYDYENTAHGYFGEVKINEESVSLGVFEQVKWERDIAIDQLKNLGYELGEKPRTDDDCISREAVIETLSNYGCTNKEGLLFKDIRELPSVKPKERTGEWIEDEEQHHVEKTWHCSECGNTAWGSYEKTTYCCQCGAKMVEPQVESEGT